MQVDEKEFLVVINGKFKARSKTWENGTEKKNQTILQSHLAIFVLY